MNNSILNVTEDEEFQVFSPIVYAIKQTVWAAHVSTTLYLAFVLILFEKQRSKTHSDPGTPHRNGNRIKSVSKITGTRGFTHKSFWWNIFGENPMCLLTLSAIALRCILLEIEFNYGGSSNSICKVFSSFFTVLGACGHFGVYALLWTRQWVLYNTKPIKSLLTKTLRVVNIGVVVGLLVAVSCTTGLLISSFNRFSNTPIGCLYHETTSEKTVITVTTAVIMVCSLFFQACLLALTVYPLTKQYGRGWFCCKKRNGEVNTSSSLQRVQKVVRRISTSCAICLGTDLLFGIGMGIHVMVFDDRTTFLLMSYNFKLTISLIAVVGSFGNWKERVFPWLRRNPVPKEGEPPMVEPK